ncbi:hypothetical protein [Rothia sp. P4278]|uniref:hypothetical protein n=1 Tax=unclassified Rothia (in: high G+C Gram-positive bacteria) TaxID=2689056 RepID=UPI003ADEA22C
MAGLSSFFRFTQRSLNEDDTRGAISTGSDEVALGRVISQVDEDRVAAGSQILAGMLFGKDLSALPPHWKQAQAYGVVSPALAQECKQNLVALNPGWAYAVAPTLKASYFLVETRALTQGSWAGTLEAGGEHLFDELLALISQARRSYTTPVLIDNARVPAGPPASFRLLSAHQRLRKAVTAQLTDLQGADYALSPFLQQLLAYTQQDHRKARP